MERMVRILHPEHPFHPGYPGSDKRGFLRMCILSMLIYKRLYMAQAGGSNRDFRLPQRTKVRLAMTFLYCGL